MAIQMYLYTFNFKLILNIIFASLLFVASLPLTIPFDFFHGRPKLKLSDINYRTSNSTLFNYIYENSALTYGLRKLRSFIRFNFSLFYEYKGVNYRYGKYVYDDFFESSPVSPSFGLISKSAYNSIIKNVEQLKKIDELSNKKLYFIHPTEDLYIKTRCSLNSINPYSFMKDQVRFIRFVELPLNGCENLTSIYYKNGAHFHRNGAIYVWPYINNELNSLLGVSRQVTTKTKELLLTNSLYRVSHERLGNVPDNGLYEMFWGDRFKASFPYSSLNHDAPKDLLDNIEFKIQDSIIKTKQKNCVGELCSKRAYIIGDSFLTYFIPFYSNYFGEVYYIKPEVNFNISGLKNEDVLIFNHIVRNIHYQRQIVH